MTHATRPTHAIHVLRDALLTPPVGATGRVRPVVDAADVARCVSLQIESLVNRGADPAPHVDRVTRRLTDATSTDALVVIEAGGACIGLLWCTALPGVGGDTSVCHLDSIVLTATERGRGLGAELMAHLEAAAASTGFAGISLNSLADNHRVPAFYERLRYRVVGLDLEKRLDGTGPRDGARPGVAGLHFRRAVDGETIVVYEPFHVTGAEQVRGIVAELERAAHGGGARRAYVTVGDPLAAEARVLQALGYGIGRYKWWKSIGPTR